jgi:hypothetical protein
MKLMKDLGGPGCVPFRTEPFILSYRKATILHIQESGCGLAESPKLLVNLFQVSHKIMAVVCLGVRRGLSL